MDMIREMPDHIVSIEDAPTYRGRWQERFPEVQPLFVDLGAGMGHFLTDVASRRPEWNCLGIELKYKRLYRSAEKAANASLRNVQYVRHSVLKLEELFVSGELSGVFVNYPDPWPKARHNKHRMVSASLASTLEALLRPGGRVRLKSDYAPYRKGFMEAFEDSAFELVDKVEDLDDWARDEENIPTSYERRFRQAGRSCFFYEFRLPV